jgi:hypothetical protein
MKLTFTDLQGVEISSLTFSFTEYSPNYADWFIA